MATKTPPARTSSLHSAAGTLLASSEATALAAADTIVFQNTGDTILRVHVTTAGTATIKGLITPANDQPVTLVLGDILIGPLDPAIYGSTVTITTATAVGSVGLYKMGARIPNGLRNPFETDGTKSDAS